MRRFYVFHYVPDAALPLYVFLVGRRQCCGARWMTQHLRGCAKVAQWQCAGDGEEDDTAEPRSVGRVLG
jgi:hypothetical protein